MTRSRAPGARRGSPRLRRVPSGIVRVHRNALRCRDWHTRREVEITLFEDINGFYNPPTKHSALGWKESATFKQRAA